MSVEVICHSDHTDTGGTKPGAVIATFDSWQDASDRNLRESYPNCSLETREVQP